MEITRGNRKLFGGRALLILGIALSVLMIGGSTAAQAETGQKALILDSSVEGGALSSEATNAVGNGFTVNVVDDATWGAMTAAQFADYQLIIVGDPDATLPAVVSQNATPLADAVMARAGSNTKAGNRMLIGTDPVGHPGQGDRLIETGIDFVGVQDGATNLYLTFSNTDPDYDGNGVPDGQDKLLPKLTIDPAGTWTQNTSPPCGAAGSVSLISNAAQFSTLTTADLDGWGCSTHESFPTFPTDWTALAIATDTPTTPTCGTDVDTGASRCGEAYILIAGSGIVSVAPNLSLTPATATNPVGSSHTVTAKVTNSDGTPRSGEVVSFLVTGANAGASGTCVPADCKSNAAGEVTFSYTGTSVGDDTINASITVGGSSQTATAAKTWVAAPPPPPPPPPPPTYPVPCPSPDYPGPIYCPPKPPSPPSLPAGCDKEPAKVQVLRGTFSRSRRTISILALITKRASGSVRITLHAAGRKGTFSVPIQDGRIRVIRRIRASQARLGTGILTIRYSGDADTRPQTVRLRAANNKARLRADRPRITNAGFLRTRGRVTRKARGIVRVQLQYVNRANGVTVTLRRKARIRNGRWRVNSRLSPDLLNQIAQRCGTLHSYTLFTGYIPRRIRGEQFSQEVAPAP